ncbi:hypothetical protein SEA_KAYLISSA_34 [Arthrobacter phage Kaylissa]|uniref:Uncharacterized protein n=2 Tax=Yangvirus TaxID=2733221 RepID=A0AA92RUN0_9CAUD|nr:hypothetical protein PQE10_gp33 [Arthrobacter phage Tbone]YP_010678080.1 hypothetical protein PQE14_gp34 [Arthrobacter phage Kaylissa]QGZ17334.1 hypothetical protein SEA_POWERPUFF_36 [Arthrobacter phage Powerpuff]QIN94525.1 hypothetical protein SEA_YESCHEF_34 [Arthrobacter phage YesChef]WGH20747.1 hypothetical protein SEA_JOHNDOE_34 [Arthrobacter phage JohnDoe]QPX62365.1 hypothetical protein SEA_TBONE_33 [Arthrobacter phage Tbone]QXO14568.1 hypothetical protein SEA_KAYLISSA_34 [Arthrobacte
MSSRPGVVTKQSVPADGGESPNRYAPFVTAEIRVFWPPKATDAEIERAIERAVAEARVRIDRRRSGL